MSLQIGKINKALNPVAPGRTKPGFPTGLLLPVPAWVTDVLWFFCVCKSQLYSWRREHGFSLRQALVVSGDRQCASLDRLVGDIWWKWQTAIRKIKHLPESGKLEMRRVQAEGGDKKHSSELSPAVWCELPLWRAPISFVVGSQTCKHTVSRSRSAAQNIFFLI